MSKQSHIMVEEIKQEVEQTPIAEEKPLNKKEIKQQKKTEKREKRHAKIRRRIFKDDIKYQGPLSYRYLRILGWIVFALGQAALLNSVFSMFEWNPLGNVWQNIFSYASSLMAPFFAIASFGMVLSGNRGFKGFIILYGGGFLLIGLGLIFFYYRYINGIFMSVGAVEARDITEAFVSNRVQVNVFADLFAFTLFHYFVNYTPRKYFQGKKIYIFRLLALLPIIYSLTSYILKVSYSLGAISNLPFALFPFMTTKSPLMVAIFVVISLWIKNREKVFIKVGASKEQYDVYLNSKRNSLSFSIILSVIIAIFAVLELIIMGILAAYYTGKYGADELNGLVTFLSTFDLGQVLPCILAIPFILLYSYTRDHENTKLDLFIPLGGIAITVIVYIEFIFNFLVHTMKS